MKWMHVVHDNELDNREILVRFPILSTDFSLLQTSRMAMQNTYSAIHWVPGTNSPGVKAARA